MIWKERKNERERETKSAHNVAGAFKQIGEAKSASDVIQPININITIRNRQIKRIVVESKIISLLTRQIENGPSLPLHARMLHHWHSYFQTISMNSPQIFSSTQLYCKHCIATICSTSNAAWWIKRKIHRRHAKCKQTKNAQGRQSTEETMAVKGGTKRVDSTRPFTFIHNDSHCIQFIDERRKKSVCVAFHWISTLYSICITSLVPFWTELDERKVLCTLSVPFGVSYYALVPLYDMQCSIQILTFWTQQNFCELEV